ncbi:Pls/PosA family non-ribosomal peptide synthetase [Streptomyces sp. NPDC002265]|uniref:Pls/PosA family non-ribosomal peptide synthetase n=1 Tax=Streptomyces sp. NPDC002265 TaxID=3154415 RepID=UPI00331C7DED
MVDQSSDIFISGLDGAAVTGGGNGAGPTVEDTEREFAEVLAGVVKADHVPADSHFFDDLGANSLVMAQFCARVRKRSDLPPASMKDIYRYPTIRSLAAALAVTTAPAPAVTPIPTASPAATGRSPEATPGSTGRYVFCGAVQLLVFLGYSFFFGLVTASGYEWVASGSGLVDIYVRSLLFGGVGFLLLCLFPIAAKWILVGRWKSGEFPLWGLAYVRLWLVKVLLHANPMVFFVGNPLYVLYLRALGARIGAGVTILSRSVPVCTDLLTIGSGTVIRKEASFLGYRAHAGRIRTGPVTLGRDVFVGEKTVLDIDTAMGDGAQLGHASSLYPGQSVPAGRRMHGSPAEPTGIDYVRVAPARCGTLRRTWFGLVTLAQMFLLYVPLAVGGMYMLFAQIPALGKRIQSDTPMNSPSEFFTDAVLLSAVLFFGFVVLGLAVLFTVPRLVGLVVEPDRTYPLYGFRYAAHRAAARMTNIKFFAWLFGDSSYIVHYLRFLGYDLSRIEQTGSNFGTEVQHETPYLVRVGTGTMVADGLSIVNADFSSTSFRVSRASIGPRNFIGNNIVYPAGGRTGENCLLATKVMVPLDGPVREGVGLLGSPPFEIPRTVERDVQFDHLRTEQELGRHLAAKNRYNTRTLLLFLLVRWFHVFVLTAFGLATETLYGTLGHVVLGAYIAITLTLTTLYFVLCERCIGSFRRLRPQLCSIYDPAFWRQERLWKVPENYLNVFNGTPFKSVVWRLLGVRIGRRVFDDGCHITERTLTAIGDDCTLNVGSKIQCHSQEDGTFKSDHTTLGARCTLGVGAHVHYGVTIGDGAVLAPDSFLMKGEEVPPYARWGGNPAGQMSDAPARSVGTGPADREGTRRTDDDAATAS